MRVIGWISTLGSTGVRRYKFTVNGRATDDQTWAHTGILVVSPGAFSNVFDEVMRQAYMALMNGQTKVGVPGVACRPPYHITLLLVEEEAGQDALT